MGREKLAKDDRAEQKCCLGLLYYAEALGATKRPVCIGLRHAPGDPVDLDQRTPIPEGVGGVKYMCLGHSAYDRLPYSQQQRLQQQLSKQQAVGSEGGAGVDASSTGESPHPAHTHLPYCEGVEIIISEMVQDAAAQQEDEHEAHAAAVAALAGAARPVHEAHLEDAARHPVPRPQQPTAAAPLPPPVAAGAAAGLGPNASSSGRPAVPNMGDPRSVLGTILSATGLNVDDAMLQRFGTRFMHVAERNVKRMRSTMSSAYDVAIRALVSDDSAPDS